MKEKIIKNTLYNIMSYGYSAIIGFLIVPFTLKNLGINLYGIWALVSLVTGYFSLIDFGIGQSFERYIAEFKTRNDTKSLNYVINSGLLFYLILFLILLPLSFLSLKFLIKILKIPENFEKEVEFIFRWAII
jgi:O-antigen/teichoic acid export membrane protein